MNFKLHNDEPTLITNTTNRIDAINRELDQMQARMQVLFQEREFIVGMGNALWDSIVNKEKVSGNVGANKVFGPLFALEGVSKKATISNGEIKYKDQPPDEPKPRLIEESGD